MGDPNCTVGKKCADFMKKYFATIDEKSYSFFIDDASNQSPISTSTGRDLPSIEELQVMSVNKLKKLASELQVDLTGCFEKREIVQLLASSDQYLRSNDKIEVNNPSIRGTTVSKSTA